MICTTFFVFCKIQRPNTTYDFMIFYIFFKSINKIVMADRTSLYLCLGHRYRLDMCFIFTVLDVNIGKNWICGTIFA